MSDGKFHETYKNTSDATGNKIFPKEKKDFSPFPRFYPWILSAVFPRSLPMSGGGEGRISPLPHRDAGKEGGKENGNSERREENASSFPTLLLPVLLLKAHGGILQIGAFRNYRIHGQGGFRID